MKKTMILFNLVTLGCSMGVPHITLDALTLTKNENSRIGCMRHEDCWPSQEEIDKLHFDLQPHRERLLKPQPQPQPHHQQQSKHQDHQPNQHTYEDPPHAGIPFDPTNPNNSGNGKELFGLGSTISINPVYTRENLTYTCQSDRTFNSTFCKAQFTNNPLFNTDPDFVLFPLDANHIKISLNFAKTHKLCIAIAGAGNDQMGRNRPNCDKHTGSILIRTTLIKHMQADLHDGWDLGHPSIKFGAGITSGEAQLYASAFNRYISTSGNPALGIAGWTLGGGYGPFSPSIGFGSDNLLAADVVLASGQRKFVSEKSNPDLLRAIRGGGGGTFAIVVSFYIKAHMIPQNGFSLTIGSDIGDLCDNGKHHINHLVSTFNRLSLELNNKASISYSISTFKTDDDNCKNDQWFLIAYAVVVDGPSSPESNYIFNHFISLNIKSQTKNLKNAYQVISALPVEEFIAPYTENNKPLSSAIVKRDQTEILSLQIMEVIDSCSGLCLQSISTSLTGNTGSPRISGTSINEGLRIGLSLYLSHNASQETLQEKFGKQLYFEQSSRLLSNKKAVESYWGPLLYKSLVNLKRKYDPEGVFRCHNCVSLEVDAESYICPPSLPFRKCGRCWEGHLQAAENHCVENDNVQGLRKIMANPCPASHPLDKCDKCWLDEHEAKFHGCF